MGRISSLKFSKRTEKRSRGPKMDSRFTKFWDEMKTVHSQEEPPIY
jgi:hypothetical protein